MRQGTACRCRIETGDVATLFVDRDHNIGASGTQLGAQLGDLHIVDNVLGKQQHATQPVGDGAKQPRLSSYSAKLWRIARSISARASASVILPPRSRT